MNFNHDMNMYNFLQFNGVTANTQSVNLSAHVDKLRLHGQIPFQLFALTQMFSTDQAARSATVPRGQAQGSVPPVV